MDAFVLEVIGSAGSRRGGRTFWTEQSAVREAERIVRSGKASNVRVLRAVIRERPVAILPMVDCEVSHA
jgi:hypothetical protein